MNKTLLKIIPLLLLTTISISVTALDPEKKFDQYVLDAWSIEKGLPQISVHTITQDQDNYLWVGTQAGLARFDGVQFKTFSADNTPELHGNFIQDLFTDSKGQLWIATYKGLTKYYQGTFTKISAQIRGEERQINISDITEDLYGDIWVSANEGTFKFNENVLMQYELIPEASHSILSIDDKVFIGTVGKLWSVNGEATKSVALPAQYRDAIINEVSLYNQQLWLGTNKGLLTYNLDTDEVTEFKTETPLFQYPIDSMGQDSDNNLWVGTIIGFFRIQDNQVIEHIKNTNHHQFQQIQTIYEDHEKNLWLGSYRDGLARVWNGRTLRFSTEQGLNEPLVWSILPSKTGDGIWTGTNRGLSFLANGQFEQVLDASELPHPTAYTLMEEDEQLWIGTRKGLTRVVNGTVQPVAHSEKLSTLQINSIARDTSNRLWLGTSDGLYEYSEEALKLITTSDQKSVFIRPITQLDDGRILVGTQKGLYQLENDSIVPIGLNNGLNQEMDVSGILQLDDSKIIISTISQGLYFFYNDYWHNFTEADGLPVNESFTVLKDNFEHLWVSGFKGLYQVPIPHMIEYITGKRDTIFAYMLLSESGGILGSQKAFCCNGAGNAKGFFLNDQLWYPTRDGVVKLDTTDIKLNSALPQVLIEQFYFGEKWHSVFTQKRFNLREDQRDVEFDFTALSFRDPKSVQFKYRLLGYQDEWRDLDTKAQRRVNYTNLPPGNYSFNVKASNNAGLWNPDIAEVNFTIAPFFYESVWFYLLCIAVIAVIISAWHKLRLRSLQLKKQELEAKIKEHTEQLEVSNRKLHEAVQALRETSQTDQLSGLKNRRYLANQLPSDLANFEREVDSHHKGDTMIFAIADIDHFKRINDEYGHKAGDNIIKKFSQVIRDHIREGDYAVRWGGEEFIIVFRPMPPAMAPIIIDRLREKIEKTDFYISRDESINITCSIGFAEYPFFKNDINRLSWEHTVEIADHALYLVKENGRNGWASIKPTATTPVSKKILFTIKDNLNEELAEKRIQIEASYLDD